jgi:hypothetical protein
MLFAEPPAADARTPIRTIAAINALTNEEAAEHYLVDVSAVVIRVG